MSVIQRILKPLKCLSRYRILQYRGSNVVYLTLTGISKLYALFFTTTDYYIVPTPYGKLYLPKKGYSSGHILTCLLDMVEPQWQPYFESLIRCMTEGVLVDIGAAADGWYSLKACKMNPKIRVVAVEPSSFEFYWLINNLTLNGCRERISLLKVALSDTDEIVDLNGEKVHSMRLDELLKAAGIAYRDVKILKIDVEGMGYRVLKGALKTLQIGKPHIFLEVHDSEEAKTKGFLEKLNYKVVYLPGAMYFATPNQRLPN